MMWLISVRYTSAHILVDNKDPKPGSTSFEGPFETSFVIDEHPAIWLLNFQRAYSRPFENFDKFNKSQYRTIITSILHTIEIPAALLLDDERDELGDTVYNFGIPECGGH